MLLCALGALCELHPGRTGAELRALLQADCAAGRRRLGYKAVREQMYGYVYNDPGRQALECAYSGSLMPCAYGSMDTQCNADLNCEHTVAQSLFGQREPMRSDIHHLRPVWSAPNSGRSNHPFGVLAGEGVRYYYGPGFEKTPERPDDLAPYSQQGAAVFEPRDSQKTDTARAVAYFYTMYPDELRTLEQTFWSVDQMVEWADAPCTEEQYAQYRRAVEVQGNENPYYEEEGLVRRAYCDLTSRGCDGL